MIWIHFYAVQTHFGIKLTERNSLIIFDEVQMFPQARAAIKYLVADGRYDYIETGSLISIRENVKNIVIPSEERHINMYPLDFEEFAIALEEDLLVEYIKKCLKKEPLEIVCIISNAFVSSVYACWWDAYACSGIC